MRRLNKLQVFLIICLIISSCENTLNESNNSNDINFTVESWECDVFPTIPSIKKQLKANLLIENNSDSVFNMYIPSLGHDCAKIFLYDSLKNKLEEAVNTNGYLCIQDTLLRINSKSSYLFKIKIGNLTDTVRFVEEDKKLKSLNKLKKERIKWLRNNHILFTSKKCHLQDTFKFENLDNNIIFNIKDSLRYFGL